jgi:hypothetical protein
MLALGYCSSARQIAAVRLALVASASSLLPLGLACASASKSARVATVNPSWLCTRSSVARRSLRLRLNSSAHTPMSANATGTKISRA